MAGRLQHTDFICPRPTLHRNSTVNPNPFKSTHPSPKAASVTTVITQRHPVKIVLNLCIQFI